MRRYKHNRSNTRVQTMDMGIIYPTGRRHVLHGTTARGNIIAGFRADPMVNPIYSEMDIMNWVIACPDRILWKDYEDFITGGQNGESRPEVPYIVAPDTGWPVGSLADYLGEPTGIPNYKSNALKFRAYALWINTYIIDDQLQSPLPISFESGQDTITNTELFNINWSKDPFTTLRPEPQLGEDVIIPIENDAPIVGVAPVAPWGSDSVLNKSHSFAQLRWRERDGNSTVTDAEGRYLEVRHADGNGNYASTIVNRGQNGSVGTSNNGVDVIPSNLAAVFNRSDISDYSANVDLRTATGTSVQALKLAMSRMSWKIKRNLYGSAYKDFLSFMGIRYSDARLQLPQTLAYGRSNMNISEVLQTAPGTDSYVGNIAGRSTGLIRSSRCKNYFEECTTVLFLCCIRPKTLYVNTADMEFNFEVREDIYTPEFAHVGNVPYYRGQLHPTGTDTDSEVLGYGNIYDFQRIALNDVAGEMKTTESTYHLGRMFENQPTLNADFIKCMPTNRIWSDMENTQHFQVVIRHTWLEKSFVSPTGDPKFNL